MNIVRTATPDCLSVLTFDRPNSAANIFDRATLTELDAHLAAIEQDDTVRGVIVASAKAKIFIAGADLNAFSHDASDEALGEMVDLGHRIFTRLKNLRVPSVALIHGVCLGGGLELALACDWRVASTDKATKLGLPETQLGILPAWGGSTRLPKLIGLPAALGMILTGKQIVGAQALKNGVVDDVTHPEYLFDAARKWLAKGKRVARATPWTSRWPLTLFVASRARREVLAKTRGHYPAPLRAIEVCVQAVGAPEAHGLALERAAFLALVRTPACRNLMSVFFLQERAKKLEMPAVAPGFPFSSADHAPHGLPVKVKRAAVIGAGTMGAGIAQWVSARGIPVKLKDVSPAALARGMAAIEKVYTDAAKRRTFTVPEATAGLDRVTPIHVDVTLRDVDLVIEAALEKLDVKQKVFRDLESRVGEETILATNTSALSIEAIASGLDRPERVVGLHFFNPVHRMQLVEIVRGPRTSPAALATALQFVKSIGKLPVIAKDSPGFLVNRILLPYMVEAVRMYGEGVPTETIDKLMLDFGMPMGPLRLADEVGLDVAQHVAKDLEARLPQPVPLNDVLAGMIADGYLGKKSGRGFYIFKGKEEHAAPMPSGAGRQPAPRTSDETRSRAEAPRDSEATLTDRLVLIMVNEAARVLDEQVVDAPEDVDFGMIFGTGWAPFRGGPCRYADSLGIETVVSRLERLATDVAPHFAPCALLREMARENRGFYAPRPTAKPERRAPDNSEMIDRPLENRPPVRETAIAK